MALSVVRIVQNRAPTEISYAMEDGEVSDFLVQWREENPGRWISGGSMPLISWLPGTDGPIPIEYP